MVASSQQARAVAFAAARILLERKNQADWSNRQISEALGWSHNTVDRYLHGDRPMPLDAFYCLTRLLQLDPSRVLRDAEAAIATADLPPAQPR
jgi:transcriptional regulator with XRE-family HTH domain